MATHSDKVLGAIINKDDPRRDLLGVAILRLTDEHFTSSEARNMFKLLRAYYDFTGNVMPLDTFIQKLQDSGVEAAKALTYRNLYQSLSELGVNEPDFRWAVEELRNDYARRQTGVVITQAMEILERGFEVNKTRLEGHKDARDFLASKLHEIDKSQTSQEAPEGNIFVEKDAILAEYEARKNHKGSRGVLTGIRCIDDRTDGLQNGELIVVAAGPGAGKSQVSTQTAWNAAVEQKKNVFFATSETLRPQVMRRILARHSRLPMFGKPDGINSADIKKGTLSESDEKIFRDVLEDWHYNKEYGQLNVVQIPPHSKLSYVENRLREWGNELDVSLCIMDYLALLEAEVRRQGEREEFNEIIRGAKGIAQGFMDGRGIPFISPWQLKRDAQEAAATRGYFSITALSDTSEIEKSADQILALLRQMDNNREMGIQFLKMRDDDIPPIQQVSIDLRSTYIGTHQATVSLAPGGSTSDDLMQFLR